MGLTTIPKAAPEQSPPILIGGAAYNRLLDMLKEVARVLGPAVFNGALNRAGIPSQGQEFPISVRGGHFFYGIIVATGPDGDADYGDNRYWIKNADIDPVSGSSNYGEYEKVNLTQRDPADGGSKWVTATNLAEGKESSHRLPVGTPVVCRQTPENGYRFTFNRAVATGLFRVTLTQTGGANGNKTTAATWSYTVKTLAGAELLTVASPEKPRPNGLLNAATMGYAYYNDAGVCVLAEAWETEETGGCTTPV